MNIRAIKQVLSRSLTHCRPWFLLQHQSLWALSVHSLQIERMTGLAQNLNLSRRSKGRGLRNTILTQLTLASNVGVEIYWGIHFHSCTNLELNRDANFVGPYFTIIS
jgi:hypothetical protein